MGSGKMTKCGGFDDGRGWEAGMAGMESMGLHGNENGLAWTGMGLHG